MKNTKIKAKITQPSYKLGHAIVVPDRNLIIRDGKEIQLPKKCFKVLAALLSQQGKSVKREDLLNDVWGVSLGSDELLNNAISKLRYAIGREYKSKKIIETVPKLGYRLSLKPQKNVTSFFSFLSQNFMYTFAFLLVLLLGFVLSMVVFKDKTRSTDLLIKKDTSITELTKLIGTEYGPSYSPNGKSILFAKVKPGKTHSDLYVQDLQSGDVDKITFDEVDEYYPVWNRSGDYIAYVRGKGPSCRIVVMYLPTRKIFEAFDCSFKWPRSLDWSVDGQYLVTSWENAIEQPHQIHQIDWRTAIATPLVEVKSKHGDVFPKYSSSGNQLAWFRRHEKQHEIVIYDVITQQEVNYKTDKSVKNISWSRDDKSLYVVSMINREKYQLSSIDITQVDPVIEEITIIDGVSSSLSVNPVTGDVVFDQYTARQQLLIIDMNTGQHDFSLESSFRDDSPTFSPSGQWLAFRSNRSGKEGLWVMNNSTRSKRSRLLFDTDQFIEGFTWLKNEKAIVYSIKKDKYYQLYLYDIERDQHNRLVTSHGNDVLPTTSHHGNGIYFSHYLDAEILLNRFNIDDHSSETLMKNAFLLRESFDGKWLYFFKYNKSGLWRISSSVVPVTAEAFVNQAELFIDDISMHDSGNWVVHDDGVIYASQQDDHFAIRNVDWNGKDIVPPIKMDTKLMRVEGNNFAYDSSKQQLVVVTDDHYVGNIRRLAFK